MNRIKGFDGLRAVSALFVFYEHKVSPNGLGALGVWTFFCLSGYLIVGILHRARLGIERDAAVDARPRALLDFWRNRALRIFPIYYLTLFVVAASGRMHPLELAFYLLYLQNLYIGFMSHSWGVITHFWSLAIEQQFYVLAAPTLIWIAAVRHRAVMQLVFFGCVAFIVVSGVAGWDEMQVSLVPLSNFAFMAVGGYVTLSSARARLCLLLANPWLLLASSILMAAEYALLWAKSPRVEVMPAQAYLAGLLFAGSLVCFVVARQNGWLVAILELRPLRWLGQVSYGFYVYHYLIPDRAPVLARMHYAALSQISEGEWELLQLGCALLLAQLSWVYFERRFLALKASAPRAARV